MCTFLNKDGDRLSYGHSLHVNIHGSELTKSNFLSCTLHELKADKCICCSFDTLIFFKRPCSLVQMKAPFLRYLFFFHSWKATILHSQIVYPDSTIAISLQDISIQKAPQFSTAMLRKYGMTFIKWWKRRIRTQQQTRSGHYLIQKAWWESSTQEWLETGNDNCCGNQESQEKLRILKNQVRAFGSRQVRTTISISTLIGAN